MFKEQLEASEQLFVMFLTFEVTNKGHLIYKILPLCQPLSFLPRGPRVSFEHSECLHSLGHTRLRLLMDLKARLGGTMVLCVHSLGSSPLSAGRALV